MRLLSDNRRAEEIALLGLDMAAVIEQAEGRTLAPARKCRCRNPAAYSTSARNDVKSNI